MDLRVVAAAVAVSLYFLSLSNFSYLFTFLIGSVFSFLCGVLSIVYLQHSDVKEFLYKTPIIPDDPLSNSHSTKDDPESVPVCYDSVAVQASIQLQQDQAPKASVQSKTKKLFSQSGLESFFKKSPSSPKAGTPRRDNPHKDAAYNSSSDDLFDQIRVHGERKAAKQDVSADSVREKIEKKKFTGQPQIDYLLHTLIDYVLRDFIHSWFSAVSEDKEFVDVRTKQSIEESVANLCSRMKSTSWQPLITTTIVDHVATHTRLYRLAQQAVKQPAQPPGQSNRLSPFRKIHNEEARNHRRNKSDTDLNWHLGHVSQKTVANSRFYTKDIKEECLFDPEMKLLHAFFDNSSKFRAECLDDGQLERYLTNVSETLLYFTLPEDDFACLPLRTFLSTLLANVVFKPLLDMISDPDFVNLQVARLPGKETPSAEFFIKMVRQCTDLSELRACRQMITKEMDKKFKDVSRSPVLGSLKYTQKLIDMRIAQLQSHKSDFVGQEKSTKKADPILTLEEILTKQLALSYYLDYLSMLNLQKYVLFYMSAQEWKLELLHDLNDLAASKSRVSRDEVLADYRDRAQSLYNEYLSPGSNNQLSLDNGLVEVLNIRIRDPLMPPEGSWFESISKFIYEKIKTEEIFLHNFYHSSAYKKLLLELGEEEMHSQDLLGTDSLLSTDGSGSDNNSGDIPFEVFEASPQRLRRAINDKDLIRLGCDLAADPFLKTPTSYGHSGGSRHCRSHSDCSGIVTLGGFTEGDGSVISAPVRRDVKVIAVRKSRENILRAGEDTSKRASEVAVAAVEEKEPPRPMLPVIEILSARIINTAINTSGQFAVYAIEVIVTTTEGQILRQWHVYRRYSKFLELKKMLEKRYPNAPNLPFPPKKTFQNTQRAVLEHRMTILNEFLKEICNRMRTNSDLKAIVKEFLEADSVDQLSGGSGGNVTRTLEIIVNPFKSGMTKIKNMPDSLVGGLSRMISGGRGPLKHHHTTYLMDNPHVQMDGAEYPALRAMLNLMDEVFDLQTRSQWLRRGIVNRVLGAPWVSSAANKKIVQAAKGLIEEDKIEMLLTNILTTLWPDGKRVEGQPQREDNTKLRTRMAAKVSLFALLGDDLGRLVGSETTRWGLLNMYSMWQNKTLNLRLCLVVVEDALKLLYKVDSLTKHVDNGIGHAD